MSPRKRMRGEDVPVLPWRTTAPFGKLEPKHSVKEGIIPRVFPTLSILHFPVWFFPPKHQTGFRIGIGARCSSAPAKWIRDLI